MEKEDTISIQWEQEDVETSYNLLNNNVRQLRILDQTGQAEWYRMSPILPLPQTVGSQSSGSVLGGNICNNS